ncbi:methyltransferase family protein [Prosthecobacter fusiformis]|uniref:Methyltransferase family protein n=1 Tax=Prosthecobacter fusiformis TaxID=48464 RepID=A0A4R7S1U7_9BACT|nr:class I SAM-dependent methyltransferase [Prosthecobacter fusiformis]TDU71398.1 methyltransferase family protein [Prosthecobacter fusiformis]
MNNDDQTTFRRNDYQSISGEQEFFVTPLLRQAIADVIDRYPAHLREAVCLDVGAGEEPLRRDIEKNGYNYQSLDIAQNQLNSIQYVTRIDVPLPVGLVPANYFDLILCTEVLEHVPDWNTAFANLFSLLKPGGIVLVTTPFFYMLHEEPHDYWRPTDHALRHHALMAGFEVLESKRLGCGWEVLGTLICSTSVCRKKKTIFSYIMAMPLYIIHFSLKFLLKRRLLQQFAELQSMFYLENIFVFQKRQIMSFKTT